MTKFQFQNEQPRERRMRENKRYNEAHLVASLNEQKNIQIYEVNYQTNNKDKSQKAKCQLWHKR